MSSGISNNFPPSAQNAYNEKKEKKKIAGKRETKPKELERNQRGAKKTKPDDEPKEKITRVASGSFSGDETARTRRAATTDKKRVVREVDLAHTPKTSVVQRASKTPKKSRIAAAAARAENKHLTKIQQMAYDPQNHNGIAKYMAALRREIALQKEPLDEPYAEIAPIVDRYELLSNIQNFEKQPMLPFERLQLAYYIEVKIPKIENIAHGHFISSRPPVTRQTRAKTAVSAAEVPPRDIYITPKGRIMLLAKPELSKIASKGSWKEVFSAVKMYQIGTEVLSKKTRELKTEKTLTPAVQAVISLSSDEDVALVDREMEYYKRFNKAKTPGIAKLRFYTDITGLKASKKDYVHFAKESAQEFETFKVAAFDKYDGSLDQKLKLTHEQKCTICKEVIDAVSKIHAEKVIHGDLKADNILYKIEDDHAIQTGLIDFGLSFDDKGKDTEFPESTFASGEYGTLFATAPELLGNKKFDGDMYKTEVWALGLALHEITNQKDVAWKKLIPKPEDRDDMPADRVAALFLALKSEITVFGEQCLARAKELQSSKRLLPEQAVELIICKMLHPDPRERISMQQANKEFAKIT